MLHCCDLWTLCFCFRDVMSLGISLVGHQKKIMSSIQTMRAQMLHLHGTGIQVWWRSNALPGRMNQNSPGDTVKCVTRQKIWKNKSTTKKKKTFHTLPVRLTFQNWQNRIIPLLLAKDFGAGAGNQETERQWKSKHARERENPTWTLLWMLYRTPHVIELERFRGFLCFVRTLSSQKVDLLIVAIDFTGFFFSKSRVNIKISKSSS